MSVTGYASWSVVASEQPTTSKWNILGTNDAAFNTWLTGTNNVITANMLATTAVLQGTGANTTDITSVSATPTQITGMTVTFTAPAGGRKAKLSAILPQCFSSSTVVHLSLWKGTVGSGTQIGATAPYNGTNGGCLVNFGVDTPSAGSVTYNAGIDNGGGGTAHTNGAAANGLLIVELI